MSSSPSQSGAASAPCGGVPRLASSTADGKPYHRHADVEAEIGRTLDRPRAEWAEMAGHLLNESLVFLIRQIGSSDRDLLGRLVHELSGRSARIARRWAEGFDQNTMEEIALQVEMEIVELVLAETPSRQSDFLEVAFGKAVERRTINAVAKRKHSPLPLQRKSVPVSDDATEPERPEELVADERPGPEEIVAELEDKARRPELIRMACAAVKDRRHLEAVILRYVGGWPITDKDPTKPSLERHFSKSEKQLRNWTKDALEAMRAAIGDKR